MRDTRKPSRPSKDPRLDSKPPAALGEAPLAPSSQLSPSARVASLQAEVERLRAERDFDADETAGMLVQIAESERMRAVAQSQVVVASERVETLQSALAEAQSRVAALEAEAAELREQQSLAEARLSSARESIAAAVALLEEMERREEMASSMRTRAVRDMLHTLGRAAENPLAEAPPGEQAAGPESSVEIVGTHDLEWDLALAESE
jgi:chromosome segregation ATPase